MRFLITGISGFAGRHLTAQLIAAGHEVFGTTRAPHGAARLDLPADHLSTVSLDDLQSLMAVVNRVRPDGVFHLAALTSVVASFAAPEETYRANLFGSLRLFASVRAAAPRCRVVWVGSCDTYGAVEAEELPVTETVPFRPLSPYAVSKAAGDLAAYQWWRAQGLDVVRVRPFNHTGPGQEPHFVCADFAQQVVQAERGARPARIVAGNLDVVRDFSDVRDVTRAYLAAWQHGECGAAYNVCSGIGRSPRQIIETLLRVSGVSATVSVAADRQRPVDVPALVGCAAKLQAASGWSPAIAWEDTLRDVLDDWRARLKNGMPSPS
jgi:GDP-4-dehydro-6-deoxy-D-mannose reductase